MNSANLPFTREQKEYTGTLGLDGEAFATCVDSGRYEDWVRAETRVGREKGVTGTPTLVINDQLTKVSSFDDLRAIILQAAHTTGSSAA